MPDLALAGLLTIATILWGVTFTVVRDAVAVYGVLSFLAVRFLIASIALGVIGARRMSLRTLLVGGAVGSALALGFVLQTIGLRYTSPTNSGLITGLVVVLTPAIAFVMYRTRTPKLYIAPVLGAFVGLALLTGESPEEFRLGDVLTMACAVAFAAHVVLLGRYAAAHDAIGFALAQMVSTAALCGIAAPIFEPMELPPREVWFALGLTGLGASALAFLIMTYVWFSIFLSWGIKSIVLKYGGPGLYRSTRPFFLGLIMGQIFVAGMWLVIDFFTGMVGNAPIGGSFV